MNPPRSAMIRICILIGIQMLKLHPLASTFRSRLSKNCEAFFFFGGPWEIFSLSLGVCFILGIRFFWRLEHGIRNSASLNEVAALTYRSSKEISVEAGS